ncbi:MAG: tRNA(Ile)-lysidine synthetase [Frankiales bacterium]|nr:tRNA(Ile)-lysidine synthetase [Frankiales bacterium]
MTGPPVATAAVRVAVRRCLEGVEGVVSAAVSGGADSLALAAALAFERPGSGAVVVDHRLQPGSEEVAAKAAAQCAGLGLVSQVLTGQSPPGEAAARALRYSLLDTAGGTVLLGHTKDDQAESVLLGLLRGSGTRAASGMAAVRGRYRRPLLDVARSVTRRACEEAGLEPWEDPHNEDPSYARVKARQLLHGLDLTDGLARSARLLREDADALDALTVVTQDVGELASMPAALRSRSLKRWAEERCGQAVTSAHVDALRALVEDWRGQGPVALPGGGRASRDQGQLAFGR